MSGEQIVSDTGHMAKISPVRFGQKRRACVAPLVLLAACSGQAIVESSATAVTIRYGAADGIDEARELAQKQLLEGAGYRKFKDVITAQGGNPQVMDRFELLPNATGAQEILSPRAGYVSVIDAEYIGMASSMIGAGRSTKDDVIDPAALDLLASRLRTPRQIEDHFTLALETGYQASEKPISEAIIESVLPKQIDDLEPTLARHGYTPKILAELLGAKPASCNKPVYGTDICDPDRGCLRVATANRLTCRRQ